MSAIILDGKTLAKEIEAQLSERVKRIKEKHPGRTPTLATILVGDDPASMTYVKMKGNACQRVGLQSQKVELSGTATTEQLVKKIQELNDLPDVAGIREQSS